MDASSSPDYIWAVSPGEIPTYVVKVRDFGSGVVEATATTTTWRSDPGVGSFRKVQEDEDVGQALTPEEEEERRQADRARSARRARQTLRWRCLSIGADRLWTFTYRENVTDLARVKRDWDKFRRLMLERWPDWQYVCVPERQERGAWHLHAASRGFYPVNVVRGLWRSVVGDGNIDVAYRARAGGGGEPPSPSRIVRYLSKYLGKTFSDEGDSRPLYRRYWSTQKIVVPLERVLIGASDMTAMVHQVYSLLFDRGAIARRLSTFLSDDWGCFWCSSA